MCYFMTRLILQFVPLSNLLNFVNLFGWIYDKYIQVSHTVDFVMHMVYLSGADASNFQ